MIIVADTSPLNYLVMIGAIDVLPKLYDRVLIPTAVKFELAHPEAPVEVRAWLDLLPAWVEVSSPQIQLQFPVRLDSGEREVFSLAVERDINSVLIDEEKARTEARRRNLDVIGTLGVLLAAGARDLIDPMAAYALLRSRTTFRTSTQLESIFFSQLRRQ